MYSFLPSALIGFHGCDRVVGEKVLAGKTALRSSTNTYDWLGHGIYFWENNPQRALQFANQVKSNPLRYKNKISHEFVIGAIIVPGHCLNLLEAQSLEIVRQGYTSLKGLHEKAGIPMPENHKRDNELLLRNLDCAVIELVHKFRLDDKRRAFDSIRGVFIEGHPLYPNAGFNERNHIQICVRNPNCIKGYFRVLDEDKEFPLP